MPAEFRRTLIHHKPNNTQFTCGCALKRIGELNWHDPYVYLKDMLARLPTQQASKIGELLLPHRWQPV